MALAAGTRLGAYEIVAPLGAGGMGEVYRARDTKLKRDVALKVLPAHFTADPDRLARFQREAEVLASLNHPHIACIHGLEESAGVRALVLECVDGPTLAERLAHEAVPIAEALRIAKQVADALAAAHERGIIHRDLKPANIKITPDGTVKVLDFGLAKAIADDPTTSDPALSPTLTAASRGGVILGTIAYMPPEQARGRPVDRRADIWAFGCVLYELLTGRQAFPGETVSDTTVAVLDREPNWQLLPPATPPNIRFVLRRCLQKDVQHRFRDAADLAIEIDEALAGDTADRPTVVAVGGRRSGIIMWAAGAIAAAVVILAIGSRITRREPAPAVSRIAISLPPGASLVGPDTGPTLAISPDGTRLAYVARERGKPAQLYLRPLETVEARVVPGSEGALEPFFSPDGEWIGFFAEGKLRKASIRTGELLAVADASDPRGAVWGQGKILFAPTRAGVLMQASDTGGAARPLTQVGKDDNSHRWPELLPGDKALLFAALRSGGNWNNRGSLSRSSTPASGAISCKGERIRDTRAPDIWSTPRAAR